MKKGFTLVEMLAVIIILAIVSLVAIPVVSGIVDEVKLGAFKRNVENIEDIVSRKAAIDSLKGDNSEKSYVYADGKSTSGDLDKAFKGKRPDEAIIHVNTSGEIEYAIYDKDLKTCASKSYSSSTYKLINNVGDKEGCLGNLEIVLFTDKSIREIPGLKMYEDEIENVKFVNDYEVPQETLSYDLSLDGDRSVVGYLVKTGEYDDYNTYDLYIYSLGKIYTSSVFKFFDAGVTIGENDIIERLETVDFENINTINTTDMSWLFHGCKALQEIINIQNLNTLNVTNMQYMFAGCESLAILDLSNFSTSNVTDMGSIFSNCKSLTTLDLSNFSTSNVTDMGGIFENCKSLTTLDLSKFDTSNVIDMSSMFSGCESLITLDLSKFNTSNVTDMGLMFTGCKLLTSLNLSNFNTSKVTTMIGMFINCISLTTLDLSKFDTSNVNYMSGMFAFCESLTELNLSNFNTSKVWQMKEMFHGCKSLINLNVENFNTTKVTNMRSMFEFCESLTTLDLSSFNLSKVTDIGAMFAFTSNLETVYVNNNWNVDNISNNQNMFYRSKTDHVTVKS